MKINEKNNWKVLPKDVSPIDNFLEIPLTKIIPSPTQPRKRFIEDKLNELAASIVEHGVLEPVLVRANGKAGHYELVCGERRWRASKIANKTTIPARLVEMTDEQVLEVQITENLQRDDLHPLDEAFGFQSLLEKVPNMDVAEIARRIGKSEKYVHQRLKLNGLIDEAKDALAKDALTLGHALELARLTPDLQKDAFSRLYETEWKNNKRVPIVEAAYLQTIGRLRNYIESDLLLKLKSAPFSLKDKSLREDGLACVDCTERTGSNVSLFDDIVKDDRCLNRSCFEGKRQTLVQIRHKEITKEASEKLQQPHYKAPIITSNWSSNDSAIIGRNNYNTVDKKKSCEFAEKAVFAEGDRIGQTETICRNPKCKIHNYSYSSSSKKKEDPSAKSKRKQEIFDIKVAEAVRRKVFRLLYEAIEVKENSLPFNRKYIEWIAAKQWKGLEGHQKELILKLLSEVFDNATNFPYEFEKVLKRFEQFGTKVLMRFMVLCSVIHYGENRYMNTFKSQDEVIQLAEDHNLDYVLLDAQERVEQVAKKHKWDADRYLIEIENGNTKAVKPEVWESPAQQKRLLAKPLIPSTKPIKSESVENTVLSSSVEIINKIEAAKNKGELELIVNETKHLFSTNNKTWTHDQRMKVRKAINAKRTKLQSKPAGRKLSRKGGKR